MKIQVSGRDRKRNNSGHGESEIVSSFFIKNIKNFFFEKSVQPDSDAEESENKSELIRARSFQRQKALNLGLCRVWVKQRYPMLYRILDWLKLLFIQISNFTLLQT